MNKVDARIIITEQDRSYRHITLEEYFDGTRYESRTMPFASIAQRPSATNSGAAGLIALRLTAIGFNVQASRLSEIDNSDSQELDWVKLGFDETEDRAAFVAALNALIDPHEFLYEAETHGSNPQSLGERGSLTRKYESAVFDADDCVTPAKQTSANPELTPLHKAKAGQVNSSAPLSQPRRGLAGDSTNHPDRRADMRPSFAGSLDSNLESHDRNRSSEILDADPQRTTDSSTTSNEMGEMRQEHAIGVEIGPELRSMHDPPVPTFELNTAQSQDPPVGTFETNTAQVYSRKGSELSASSISETSECEKQGSAPDETSAKQKQWRRRICRKIVVFMLWKWEQNDGIPNELFSSPASFEVINGLKISRVDKIKGLFETYSGREWDWWPFDPPAKPLESGKVRIRWQCVGELNSIIPCTSANGQRPVAINAQPMHRGTSPGSAKPWSMRIQQLGMKVAMPHLSHQPQPLVTHTLGALSQGRSPATPRNQPESPLIYVPPHKPVISRIPTKAAI